MEHSVEGNTVQRFCRPEAQSCAFEAGENCCCWGNKGARASTTSQYVVCRVDREKEELMDERRYGEIVAGKENGGGKREEEWTITTGSTISNGMAIREEQPSSRVELSFRFSHYIKTLAHVLTVDVNELGFVVVEPEFARRLVAGQISAFCNAGQTLRYQVPRDFW
ncbi:hypothetical protein C8R42DRAFT_644700 [Lentinula raphanica]|nr:hypothetical protein C8R42DRAFT_644700 [Lentinula raphanica]